LRFHYTCAQFLKTGESLKMKFLIYGCGVCGREEMVDRESSENDSVLAFSDSNSDFWGKEKYGLKIIPPSEISNTEFDKIIISPIRQDVALEIYLSLLNLNIPREKIGFRQDFNHYNDRELLMERMSEVFLGEIPGAFAECGVHRGDFAEVLNRNFPDRKLYLFDTFEGFDSKDIDDELSLGNEDFEDGYFFADLNDGVRAFKDTSVEFVRSRMVNPDNVIFKKGWIPDTFEGVDDLFAFVRLDLDLYSPMLAGLKFFYPKMAKGGIMLLHDYGYVGRRKADYLPGVKKAIADFEAEGGVLIKIPCTFSSDLMIVKPY
jgi:hypothetical protein